MQKLKNCRITHQDSDVIATWDITSKFKHTGVTVTGNTVYSICSGVILHVGKHEDRYSVIVQYTSEMCVIYSLLSSTDRKLGQLVKVNEVIGTTTDNVRFECAVTAKQPVLFSVRVGSQTYYKIDPWDLLIDPRSFPDAGLDNVYVYNFQTWPTVDITEPMGQEFGNNRGE